MILALGLFNLSRNKKSLEINENKNVDKKSVNESGPTVGSRHNEHMICPNICFKLDGSLWRCNPGHLSREAALGTAFCFNVLVM